MKEIEPAKLALLINDTIDAVERSKMGSVYLKNEDGTVRTTPDGVPYINQPAMNLTMALVQGMIMRGIFDV